MLIVGGATEGLKRYGLFRNGEQAKQNNKNGNNPGKYRSIN